LLTIVLEPLYKREHLLEIFRSPQDEINDFAFGLNSVSYYFRIAPFESSLVGVLGLTYSDPISRNVRVRSSHPPRAVETQRLAHPQA
jgi:hypothetical protein